MAGVTSIPVACCTAGAKAQTTLPPPHATSSRVSCGPALLNSINNCNACWSAMVFAEENGTACRVN